MGRAGKKDKEEKKYGKEIRRREKNAQNVSVTGGKNANVKNSLHVHIIMEYFSSFTDSYI